jgi:hypothetical protein
METSVELTRAALTIMASDDDSDQEDEPQTKKAVFFCDLAKVGSGMAICSFNCFQVSPLLDVEQYVVSSTPYLYAEEETFWEEYFDTVCNFLNYQRSFNFAFDHRLRTDLMKDACLRVVSISTNEHVDLLILPSNRKFIRPHCA